MIEEEVGVVGDDPTVVDLHGNTVDHLGDHRNTRIRTSAAVQWETTVNLLRVVLEGPRKTLLAPAIFHAWCKRIIYIPLPKSIW